MKCPTEVGHKCDGESGGTNDAVLAQASVFESSKKECPLDPQIAAEWVDQDADKSAAFSREYIGIELVADHRDSAWCRTAEERLQERVEGTLRLVWSLDEAIDALRLTQNRVVLLSEIVAIFGGIGREGDPEAEGD